MSEIKPWLTVKEAAFLIGKDTSRIYRWISERGLENRVTSSGIAEVSHRALMLMESETRRGPRRHTTSSV